MTANDPKRTCEGLQVYKRISEVFMCRVIILFFIFFITFSSAYALSKGAKEALRHAQLADQSQKSGDWEKAKMNWAKAVKSAEEGSAPENMLTLFYYEYGRSLGATCNFSEAEIFLLKANRIDKKIGEPVFLSLTELARLNLDQNKFDEAIKYFELSFIELDKVNAKKESPAEYANLLDEYSKALESIGKTNESEKIREKSESIKKNNPKRYSITDRTPYGLYCTK